MSIGVGILPGGTMPGALGGARGVTGMMTSVRVAKAVAKVVGGSKTLAARHKRLAARSSWAWKRSQTYAAAFGAARKEIVRLRGNIPAWPKIPKAPPR